MSPEIYASQRSVRYTKWVLRNRWWVLLASLITTVLLATGGQHLTFATNYRVFFGEDNTYLTTFESLQNIYTKNDNILFVIAPKDGKVFTPQTLDVVESITEKSWQLPYAIRVDALTNFQYTRAEEDDLIVEDLAANAAGMTEAELQSKREIALKEPLLNDRLITDQSHVTGVNVTLQLPGESITEVPTAVQAARELAAQIQNEHPHIDIKITGLTMLNNAFSEAGIGDMTTLVPLMYLAMTIVMFIFLRSVAGTVATLLVITFSTAIAMGLAGFLGVKLTPPSGQAPTIIMTLAIADSIHILVTLLREMRAGRSKHDAIIESLRVNIQPVFLTTISTIIGFLTLNASDVPPFHHLGNITAAGVAAAFVYSVLFLPALIAVFPMRIKVREQSQSTAIDKFANLVVHRRRPLLWSAVVIVIGLASFIPQNQLDDRFLSYFSPTVTFRADSDFAVQNLSGMYQIEFSLPAKDSGGISDPAYLQTLENFANWYRTQPEVRHVNTITDVMKRLNKNMHGDDPSYERLPDNRELAAQYLLLYEMSLPYGLDLNNQINVDKSATRFVVTLDDISAAHIREMTERGEKWLLANAPETMHVPGSGPSVMFAYISGENIRSMLSGSVIALILISGIMVFALRSLKMGALSLFPNLIPAAMGFGIWGILSGRVDMGLSPVVGMTLGIVVDDTVHFLSKYLRARREQSFEAPDAVRYAFSTVGPALVVTSTILVIGFAVLSFSSFSMNANMGQLTAITITMALLADFLFLPPLLMAFDKRKQSVAEKTTEETAYVTAEAAQD